MFHELHKRNNFVIKTSSALKGQLRETVTLTCLILNVKLGIVKLTIGSCFRVRNRVVDARGKFGEHEKLPNFPSASITRCTHS